MKVIFAAGIYPPDIGGPAIYTERLASQLKQPVISYSRRLKKYPKGLRHLLYFCSLLWLARKAETIYAQNVTSAGFPAFLVSKILRKKLVLKVVGDAAWEQQKKYLRKIQTLVAKGADSIIVPSHYVKKMVQGWGVLGEKIKVIYNAPEPAPQLRVSKTEAKERIGLSGDIILSIGRLVPWKGFSDLIAIMPDLLKVNPKFQLVIVGQGKERLPSGPGVKLVGSVPHSLVPLYFKAADIFVLNSGYEGLSHAILEAMQFGVPVIASREGGNPELIEDNFNGLLVEYKNRKEIKEAILKLWQNRDLQEKFIRNSKEKLKDFSWENLVKKTLEVLRK
jgi:glycosyltransferase involved in cell wall biosynthesis